MKVAIRTPGVVLLIAAVIGACQSLAPAPEIDARTFLSVAIAERGVPKQLVAGTVITLDFKPGGVTANAGCNTMGGSYRIESGRFLVSDLFMTDMGCDAARMAQDSWLSDLLGSKPSIVLVGDELTIQSDTVQLGLRDRRAVVPDRPIAGPTWTVESIFNGETVSSVPDGLVATIVFHPDGTIEVDDGCNRGSGRWQPTGAGVDDPVGSGIEISELGLTKKACPGPAGELENAVLATLRADAIVAAISGDRLILRAGAAGLELKAR